MAKKKTKRQYINALQKRADYLTNENYHNEASLLQELNELINQPDFGPILTAEASRILDLLIDKSWV